MSKIIGVDIGARKLHWFQFADGKLDWDTVPLAKSQNFGERLYTSACWNLGHWVSAASFDVDYWAIEEPPYVNNHRVYAQLAAVAWLVEGAARCSRTAKGVFMLKPAVWRKAAMLAGNAGKPEVKERAISLYGLPGNLVQDVYDACLIAHAVRMQLGAVPNG